MKDRKREKVNRGSERLGQMNTEIKENMFISNKQGTYVKMHN